jgi:aspartyl/asparaginyl beta-hydroxylase (cupin superfamily)
MKNNVSSYRYIDTFDVSEISKSVSSFDTEWVLDTSRQKMFKEHKDTYTYMIQNFPLGWSPGYEINVEKKYVKEEHYLEVKHIIDSLLSTHPGLVARVMYIKLPSKKNVPHHRDSGWYLSNVRRFHIPILTNDEVSYTVNDELKFMKVGECWEINNTAYHSVFNDGDTDRVHLVVDIIPKEVLNEN